DQRWQLAPIERHPDQVIGGVMNDLAEDLQAIVERDSRVVAIHEDIDLRVREACVVSAVESRTDTRLPGEERADPVRARADSRLQREAVETGPVREVALPLLSHDLRRRGDADAFPEVEHGALGLRVGVLL